MKKDFWLERWEKDEIGFHDDEVNPYLTQFWNELKLATDATVFVPLCGKSVDMLSLAAQGHSVIGVELSSIAVQDFFKENGTHPKQDRVDDFDRYQEKNINLLCGDFFDLSANHLSAVNAVYDRAAMVALPPEMRGRYVKHLVNILPPATKILLITFDYPQHEMQGPPFAVTPAEVEVLYSEFADIRLLLQKNVLDENPRFKKRGLTALHERIYLLELRK